MAADPFPQVLPISGSGPTHREAFVVSSPSTLVPRDDGTTQQERHSLPVPLPVEEHEFQPPNGGLQAYLKVLGCFFIFFITLGLASTFGSYQAYYEQTLLQSWSSSAISWIGAIQVFLLSFMGTLSGAVYDRGYGREVLILGSTMVVLGMCMLSLAREYWQIVLAQGLCVGIGSGLLYVPAVSIVSNSFTTKRASALGLAATGSAVGGVVLPIAFRRLSPTMGVSWVNRIFGFIILILAVLSYFLLTSTDSPSHTTLPRRHPFLGYVRSNPRHRSLGTANGSPASRTERRFAAVASAFKDRAYIFLCAGIFFVFLGYWIPLFYVVPFASLSLGTSSSYASYLLSILNAGSFFGRVVPAWLGQIFGTAIVLLVGALALGILVFVWLSIGTVTGITVWCLLIGFMSGIVVSVPNAVASRLSKPSNLGMRIGIMWTSGAFAELIGAPIAGLLVTKNNESVSYVGGQVFGGVSILLGALFLTVPAWSIFKDDKLRQARNE